MVFILWRYFAYHVAYLRTNRTLTAGFHLLLHIGRVRRHGLPGIWLRVHWLLHLASSSIHTRNLLPVVIDYRILLLLILATDHSSRSCNWAICWLIVHLRISDDRLLSGTSIARFTNNIGVYLTLAIFGQANLYLLFSIFARLWSAINSIKFIKVIHAMHCFILLIFLFLLSLTFSFFSLFPLLHFLLLFYFSLPLLLESLELCLLPIIFLLLLFVNISFALAATDMCGFLHVLYPSLTRFALVSLTAPDVTMFLPVSCFYFLSRPLAYFRLQSTVFLVIPVSVFWSSK